MQNISSQRRAYERQDELRSSEEWSEWKLARGYILHLDMEPPNSN